MNKLAICIVFLSFSILLRAQQNELKIDNSYLGLRFENFTSKVYQEHHIRIFFKKEWVSDLIVSELAEDNDLIGTIQIALYARGLHLVEYQNNLVVLPGGIQSSIPGSKSSTLVVVGNPLDEGKFAKAKLSGRLSTVRIKLQYQGLK